MSASRGSLDIGTRRCRSRVALRSVRFGRLRPAKHRLVNQAFHELLVEPIGHGTDFKLSQCDLLTRLPGCFRAKLARIHPVDEQGKCQQI
jgi:hypothetical protein